MNLVIFYVLIDTWFQAKSTIQIYYIKFFQIKKTLIAFKSTFQ
jgi:hypothetical protein